jgi:CRISPR-associated protein Cmr3
MMAWIIEPHEPLIVRDGRPFDLQPGVIAATLPFPFPSTTAGAARSRAGSEDGIFTARDEKSLSVLKSIQVRGPLLAEFDENQERWKLLVPTPGDALLLENEEPKLTGLAVDDALRSADEKPLRCKQLVPLLRFDGSAMKPIKGAEELELMPVGPVFYKAEKPAKNLPAFWYWERFEQWLLTPEQIQETVPQEPLSKLGMRALRQDQRIHVSLELGMMVAREGALFETRGLEFTRTGSSKKPELSEARRLALWLDVGEDGDKKYKVQSGLDSLGGERRLVNWQQSELYPVCPSTLREQIAKCHACRLILLTPAYFKHGYLPDVKLWEYAGVEPRLQAALVQRPQVVSGWDMAKGKGGEPKPTRRLAPAGSVFFFKFPDTLTAEALGTWVEHTWMNCVSDEEQDRLDGFGLAVLGTWSGKPEEMRLEEDQQ